MTLAKTASNGFADHVPERDAQGLTAQEFAEHMFEFEYCSECAGDIQDHTYVIDMMGNWFAFCEVSQ